MMKKKGITILSTLLLICSLFCSCTNKNSVQENDIKEKTPVTESSADSKKKESPAKNGTAEEKEKTVIPDGKYTADFDTDNSMFHVSEACDGKGILTVENGEMTIHISLISKKIVNLYPGLAEDAEKNGTALLMPTEDTVIYSDGLTEEVYGFDVPVPALEKEFDLALLGTKGTWYDHKVKVSNPELLEKETQVKNPPQMEDGAYTVDLSFEGGSGKAKILSPATVTVSREKVTATIQWSSPNYDYMLVDGEKYLPINTEGDSVFEIPVRVFDKSMDIIGNTVTMSTPHEIAYTLTFYSDTMKSAE